MPITEPILPAIDNNGTSAAELIGPRRAAIALIDQLERELQRITPNGRDYPEITQFDRDRMIHYDRLYALNQLRNVLTEEALYIKRHAGGED